VKYNTNRCKHNKYTDIGHSSVCLNTIPKRTLSPQPRGLAPRGICHSEHTNVLYLSKAAVPASLSHHWRMVRQHVSPASMPPSSRALLPAPRRRCPCPCRGAATERARPSRAQRPFSATSSGGCALPRGGCPAAVPAARGRRARWCGRGGGGSDGCTRSRRGHRRYSAAPPYPFCRGRAPARGPLIARARQVL